jgi:hypothetical protein
LFICNEYSDIDSSNVAYIEPLLNSNCITGCPSRLATHFVVVIISAWKAASVSYVPYGVELESDENEDGSEYM